MAQMDPSRRVSNVIKISLLEISHWTKKQKNQTLIHRSLINLPKDQKAKRPKDSTSRIVHTQNIEHCSLP